MKRLFVTRGDAEVSLSNFDGLTCCNFDQNRRHIFSYTYTYYFRMKHSFEKKSRFFSFIEHYFQRDIPNISLSCLKNWREIFVKKKKNTIHIRSRIAHRTAPIFPSQIRQRKSAMKIWNADIPPDTLYDTWIILYVFLIRSHVCACTAKNRISRRDRRRGEGKVREGGFFAAYCIIHNRPASRAEMNSDPRSWRARDRESERMRERGREEGGREKTRKARDFPRRFRHGGVRIAPSC